MKQLLDLFESFVEGQVADVDAGEGVGVEDAEEVSLLEAPALHIGQMFVLLFLLTTIAPAPSR